MHRQIHIYIYIYMHIHRYIYVCVHTNRRYGGWPSVCAFTYIFTKLYTYIFHIYIHQDSPDPPLWGLRLYKYLSIYINAHIYIKMYICIFEYISMHTSIHICSRIRLIRQFEDERLCLYVYICMHINVHMYIFIHICIFDYLYAPGFTWSAILSITICGCNICMYIYMYIHIYT